MTAATATPVDLRAKLAGLVEQRDQLQASIAAGPASEEAARREQLSKAGRAPGGRFGDPAETIRAKIGKDTRSLESVSANVAVLEGMILEEDAAERARLLAELDAEAEERREEQRKAVRAFGVAFATAHGRWLDVLAVTERFDRWRETAAQPLMTPDEYTGWRHGPGRLAIEPMPTTFATMLEWALSATCDPHGEGYRDATPGHRKLDDYDELRLLLPDLRETNRNLVASGRVPRPASSSWGSTFGNQPA